MSTTPDRVLGIHISAGIAYCAVVACPDTPLFDDPLERLQLAAGIEVHDQLADFEARFGQELRRLRPIAVGVIYPKRYAQWKYADAFRRVALEAVIMTCVANASTSVRTITYRQVKQDAMASTIGIPLPKLAERGSERWGPGIPKYEKERVYAFAAATALAKGAC